MLSNPPYGKGWKTDLQRMGGRKEMRDPRFMIEHAGDPEYSLVTRSSDGQMPFLANKLSRMKQGTRLGSRIAEVHNGSSLLLPHAPDAWYVPGTVKIGYEIRDLPEVRRIRQYSEANRRMGYPRVEMRTPKELEHETGDDRVEGFRGGVDA